MKPHLLSPDRDIDVDPAPLPNEADLVGDLELEHLFEAMAWGDRYLYDIARAVVLHGLADPGAITYRQDVLRDCLARRDVIRELYVLCLDTFERKRKFWMGGVNPTPGTVLSQSVSVLEMLTAQLAKLRALAERHREGFHSLGLTTLLDTLVRELDDGYVAEVRAHLAELRFRYGVRMSARLGDGNEGTDYVLHTNARPPLRERLGLAGRDVQVVQIADRDLAGAQALAEIRDRGLRLVAAALSQSTRHIVDFFTNLRGEVAFYVGCLNLAEALEARNQTVCFPDPTLGTTPTLVAAGLYDPCLSLVSGRPVVANDVDADGASVVFVTGANRGGKSTLLRGIGIAQVMMQAGMFVAARSFRSELRPAIFTHFKREEDATMTSGKLDEELVRMSGIVDLITPTSLLLCNESFASTNESEGSQIAAEIVTALRDAGVKIVYVTHMYELAHGFYAEPRADQRFLRASAGDGGERPFSVTPGEPLATSHGADIYRQVFGTAPA